MVIRRKIITSAGILGIVSIAGCLDEFSDDDLDTESEDQSELSNDDQNSDADGTSESDTQDEGDTEGTDEVEDTDPHVSEKEEIAALQAESIHKTNDAQSKVTDSVRANSNENYGLADRHASDAQDLIRDSDDLLSDAVTLTYEISHPEAREILEEGEEYNSHIYEAAVSMELATSASERGDHESALEHVEDSQASMQSADRINPRGSEILRTVLDLD